MTHFNSSEACAWISGHFPEFESRLPLLTQANGGTATDEQLDLADALIDAAQDRLDSTLEQAGLPGGARKGGSLVLRADVVKRLVAARGDAIETEVKAFLQTLKEIHDAKGKGSAAQSSIMLAAGIVAVSPPGTPRPPVIPVIEEAMEDASASTEAVATEAEAEAVAEAAAVLGPEVIAALLVVIAIIIILWFILKDANCYVVMLNQSKAPVVFLNEYKISGQPGSVAQNIPAVETITRPGIAPRSYVSAGLFEFHRKMGVYGSQYGFTVENQGRHIAFGVECPLNGSNKAYVHFNQSAKTAAENVDKHAKIDVSTKDAKGSAQLRCQGHSGSPAYFIGRIT